MTTSKSLMLARCSHPPGLANFRCCFWEHALQCTVAVPASLATTLERVGPRLRQLRTQRGITLTTLATATGISKSTLSRLESGQRKPSLELLLPLATAFRVPLDDLVG